MVLIRTMLRKLAGSSVSFWHFIIETMKGENGKVQRLRACKIPCTLCRDYCAMEATDRRIMTDAELVPQLPAIGEEIKRDI